MWGVYPVMENQMEKQMESLQLRGSEWASATAAGARARPERSCGSNLKKTWIAKVCP